MESSEVLSKLFAPFESDDVAFRPGYEAGSGFRVFLYLDKRSIRDRLDETVGQFNWTAHYEPLNEGFICQLKIRVDGEWHTREGVGAPSETMITESNKVKSAATDAFRNAAAAWGFGRHLDNLPVIIWPGEKNPKGKWRKWQNEQKLRQRITDLLRQQLSKASRHTVIDESCAGTSPPSPPADNVVQIHNRPLSGQELNDLARRFVADEAVSRDGHIYLVKVNPKITYRITQKSGQPTCECERFTKNPSVRCEHIRAVSLWVKQPARPDSRNELKLLITDALDAGFTAEQIDGFIARVCDGVYAIDDLDGAQIAKALRSLNQKLEERRLKERASA